MGFKRKSDVNIQKCKHINNKHSLSSHRISPWAGYTVPLLLFNIIFLFHEPLNSSYPLLHEISHVSSCLSTVPHDDFPCAGICILALPEI